MNFKNIPVTCQPAYAWLWNTQITKSEIRRQIDEMYENGIRAFYVLAEPPEFRIVLYLNQVGPPAQASPSAYDPLFLFPDLLSLFYLYIIHP